MRFIANMIVTLALTGSILHAPHTTGLVQGLWIAAFTLSLVYVGSLIHRIAHRTRSG